MEDRDQEPGKARLTESSLVSIGLVVILLGATAFVSQGFGEIADHTRRINTLEERQDRYNQSVGEIKEAIVELKILSQQKDKERKQK